MRIKRIETDEAGNIIAIAKISFIDNFSGLNIIKINGENNFVENNSKINVC